MISLVSRSESLGALTAPVNPPAGGSLGFPGQPGNNGNANYANRSLRDAFAHATAEQRQQVLGLASYLRNGDIRAAADLTPAGDVGFLIPSIVQQVMEKDYAAFNPVAQVARLWSTDTGEPAVFPVLSDSESAV